MQPVENEVSFRVVVDQDLTAADEAALNIGIGKHAHVYNLGLNHQYTNPLGSIQSLELSKDSANTMTSNTYTIRVMLSTATANRAEAGADPAHAEYSRLESLNALRVVLAGLFECHKKDYWGGPASGTTEVEVEAVQLSTKAMVAMNYSAEVVITDPDGFPKESCVILGLFESMFDAQQAALRLCEGCIDASRPHITPPKKKVTKLDRAGTDGTTALAKRCKEIAEYFGAAVCPEASEMGIGVTPS